MAVREKADGGPSRAQMPQTGGGAGASRFEVGPESETERVDRFLATRLGASRRRVREWMAFGAISLDGRPLGLSGKGVRLVAGSVLEVAEDDRLVADRILVQPELSLTVLAEGDGWMAVDKPAGVAVHPLRGGETGCVLNAVAARVPEIQGVGEGGLRSGVVHRLDVDTSGVLLVATRQARWEKLRQAFRTHRVEKVYRAVVMGCLRCEPGEAFEFGLRVGRHRPAYVTVCEPGLVGTEERGVWRATQTLRVLESFADASLVEVRPQTGFLHQIRATLAHLGHPVLGDTRYGTPESAQRAERHLLHAASATSDDVSAQSPDAPDFARFLELLRVHRESRSS